jgi:hypothetical protein
MHLELLEPGWTSVNQEAHWFLGAELPKWLVQVVDHLRYPVPKSTRGGRRTESTAVPGVDLRTTVSNPERSGSSQAGRPG